MKYHSLSQSVRLGRVRAGRTRVARIRVAHCLQTIWSGGVERRRLSLARSLAREEYEQIIICTEAKGDMRNRFEDAGCRVHEIGQFRIPLDPGRIVKALPLLRGFRPHIAHGAVFEGTSTAAIAGRLARVPIVIGEETSDPQNRGPMGHALFRLLAELTDCTVAVSPAVREYLTQTLRIPEKKAVLITNGIAEPAAADPGRVSDIRSGLGLRSGDLLVGAVGRVLDDHKRFSDLITALAQVRRARPDTHLVIVGDGPDRAALEQQAAALDIGAFVHFAGYQGDTRPWFEAMDVFAHVAAREAFGLVLVEAMFAARPVLATRVGGMPGIVDEGVTGTLVAPKRPDLIAAELGALLDAPERRRAMGSAGLARARAHFHVDRYVGEVEALYQSLFARKGRP